MARRVKHSFDPFEFAGVERPKVGLRSEAMQRVAQVLDEEIRNYLSQAKSPVSKVGRFRALSKEYRDKKLASGRPGIPNLEFFGDMLAAMQVRKNVKKRLITVEISGKQGDKADGHNNHSGESNLPTRRFIPTENEQFNQVIQRRIKSILEEFE